MKAAEVTGFRPDTLPIGGSFVKDKRPEVIAAMTAAEILTALVAYRDRSSS